MCLWRWALINSGATAPSPSDCLSLPYPLLCQLSPSPPRRCSSQLKDTALSFSPEVPLLMRHCQTIMSIFVPKQTTPLWIYTCRCLFLVGMGDPSALGSRNQLMCVSAAQFMSRSASWDEDKGSRCCETFLLTGLLL